MSERRKKTFPKVVPLRSKEEPLPVLPMHYVIDDL